MDRVSFQRKIESLFSYQINVITIEKIKNKVLNSKETQTINKVALLICMAKQQKRRKKNRLH